MAAIRQLSESQGSPVCRGVAAQLAEARADSGMSRERLAWRAGATEPTIANYENEAYTGHGIRKLEAMARALGKRLTVVLEDDPCDE